MPITIHDGRTNDLYQTLTKCEDIQDMQLFFDRNSGYFTDWKAFINYLLDLGGYSYTEFARLCDMSRNTIISWCEQGKIPRSREQFIRIGFAVNMSLGELNDFLQRYGKYPRLTAKNIEDAVTIFSVQNHLTYNQCLELKEHFSSIFQHVLKERKSNRNKAYVYFSTKELESQLLNAKTLLDFEMFIEKNITAFTNCYINLVDFLDSYICLNTADAHGVPRSLNSFLQETVDNPSIAAGFNTMVSKLRCRGTVPSRIHLIALGIHLRMTANDIDTMLCFAGMEPLCAKDKLESVILFAAECAVIQNPEIEFSNAFFIKQYTRNTELKEKCDSIISSFEITGYRLDNSADLFTYITDTLFTIDSDIADDILYLLGKKPKNEV
ncbi:MAG: helix-turn-helix domain-containing protein [Bacteroidales bacterium]|nr:helix-turn-helix domain-containing protein [Clostridium sp.]MCM1204540.1 helix-turn-helix domain-containing protein [Bacteroidales bacterium]